MTTLYLQTIGGYRFKVVSCSSSTYKVLLSYNCAFCSQVEETSAHLFLECDFAVEIECWAKLGFFYNQHGNIISFFFQTPETALECSFLPRDLHLDVLGYLVMQE